MLLNAKKSPLDVIYKLDNLELERASTEKDVGVNITNSLTWNTHIHAITAKANKLEWFLLILMFMILFLLFFTAKPD